MDAKFTTVQITVSRKAWLQFKAACLIAGYHDKSANKVLASMLEAGDIKPGASRGDGPAAPPYDDGDIDEDLVPVPAEATAPPRDLGQPREPLSPPNETSVFMTVFKNVGAAVLGWIVMAVVVFAGSALAWAGLGAEGSFQPESWSPSALWIALSVVIALVAATTGGVVCARVAASGWAVWVLVGVVLVLGVLGALSEPPVAAGPRPEDVAIFEAMTNAAREPRWLTWLTPLLGAAGALFGAKLARRERAAA